MNSWTYFCLTCWFKIGYKQWKTWVQDFIWRKTDLALDVQNQTLQLNSWVILFVKAFPSSQQVDITWVRINERPWNPNMALLEYLWNVIRATSLTEVPRFVIIIQKNDRSVGGLALGVFYLGSTLNEYHNNVSYATSVMLLRRIKMITLH